MSKLYDIYMEGFHAQGNAPARADYVGFANGETFTEACATYYRTQGTEEDKRFYDVERNTYYGCRLFETMTEAQRSFG